MKDSSPSLMKKGTKAALALAVSMILFLQAAHASSALTLQSSNPQHFGWFGESVAISGTTMVVGAPQESGGGYSDAGHAYIIDTTANALPITLTSPHAIAGGVFGFSVAISGTTVVVGAPQETANGPQYAGAAYIFDAATGTLLFTLMSPHAESKGGFGLSVAISGTTVVVGAPDESVVGHGVAGAAYIFDATTGLPVFPLTSPNAENGGLFGLSVAISGTTAVVGAPGETAGAGRAYVFDATTGLSVFPLTSRNAVNSGLFGYSVAISGTTVVVGAPGEAVFVFPFLLPRAGNAYVFDATSGSWIRTLTSPNAATDGDFGSSVAISGTTVVVGAPGEAVGGQAHAGNAYTFDDTTGTPIATLTSPYALANGEFGTSVAVSECDPTVVVGALGETASGQTLAGHAYIFP